jgi:hypothetical protein
MAAGGRALRQCTDGGTTADTALRYTPTVQRVSSLAFRYALLELGLDPEACGTRDGSMTD